MGLFSQAIRADGFLYLSGQVGLDAATGKLVAGGVAAQTERVLRNLQAVLKTADRDFDDVVRAGVYLTNIGDFTTVNEVYATHFTKPYPARTTIAVVALPLGAAVEIDLIVKA